MPKFSDKVFENSGITVKGILAVTAIDRDGNILFSDAGHNLVVVGASEAIAMCVSDAANNNKIITKIGVGTSGTEPASSDTALTGAYITNIDSFAYPSSGRVVFSWSLGYGEANGMNIQEFGLLTADNTLFARKTRDVISKSSDLALMGDWTLIF